MPSITRRQMLLGGSAAGVVAVAGGFGAGAAAGWGWWGDDTDRDTTDPTATVKAHQFFTRPDLKPPVAKVIKKAPGIDPGYVFIAPWPGMAVSELPEDGVQAGPMIIDNDGEPVWCRPTSTMELGKITGLASDFRVQRYQGKPVLTYWRGDLVVPPGFGRGEYVILDQAYRELHTVRAAKGLDGDMHEFLISEDDTAFIAAYRETDADGRPVIEGVVQEIDIPSGEVKFEWHSLDHVSPEESLEPLPEDPKAPYPYFHLNSIEPDGDALLLSARHTSTVYRVDRASGKVLWRLGGQRSDFEMRPGTYFKRQHDARRLPDGRISLFDNGYGAPPTQSRAIVLELDEDKGIARLVRSHKRAQGATSASQGNMQITESGHAFVGWGSEPFVTEFTAAGNVVFDADIGGELDSYRAYRLPWTGRPDDKPAAAATTTDDEGMKVYASWNGATEVVGWRVLTGSDPAELSTATEVARVGFETEAKLGEQASYAAVAALDSDGKVLGTSEPVQPVA